MIKEWFPWLLALVLIMAIFFGPNSRAQDARSAPLARFSCEGGVCTTTEREVDLIEKVIKLLVDKVRELQNKTGCT